MSTPPNDPAPSSLAALRQRYGERYRWLLLLALMVGTIAAVMSSTVVNVAIPDLSHHFGLAPARAQWVTSGFMVAQTVAMLTTPWLLTRFGYRRTYEGCMGLLLAGGLSGGMANQFPLVLAGRVAEGIAAGALMPIPAIVIMRAFEPHEQGRASGIFGMGVVLAPALGPSIGGVLIDWFDWRAIFYMVVPFCIVSLWLARRLVPNTAPGGVAAGGNGAPLDWSGLLLGGTGTLCLLNGLVALRSGPPLEAWGLLGAAAAALVTFVGWQRHRERQGRQPLMHLALFRYRQFAMGSVVSFIYGAALFGSTYLVPVYLQSGLQRSASFVGLVLLPAGLILGGTIALVGRLADRHPAHWLVCSGLAMLTASFALMVTISLDSSLGWLLAWTVLGRIGLGFVMPSLNLGAMRGLDPRLIAQSASAINFVRMLGGSAGVSLCAIVLEWRLAAHGASLGHGASTPQRLAAFNESFLLLAALCLLATAAAWQLRVKPAHPEA